MVPSEEAVRRGAEIAENTLLAYHRTHGEWPGGTGVILWGFETTKTRGETVGQVLAYFGVRIAAGANPWYKKLAAIPLVELGRPRVDCRIQICGFFRDMYPNVVSLLNRAAELAAGMDEPDDRNYVRRHTQAVAERLDGELPESAAAVAAARVYGPRPGEYGTSTVSLIETGAWQDEQQIAERVQYLIGFAATTHAVQDWVFSAVHQRFIDDEAMFQRLTENNRFATEEIVKRLFEAEQRGY